MNRWMAGHIFWPLTEWMVRRDTMRRFKWLKHTEKLSAEQLRDLQQNKLRKLLQTTDRHCPFYQEYFRRAGLDPNDPNLTVDDLKRLPTLNRDDIRNHLEQMSWHNCPRGGAIPYTTGGSSGEPLKFYFDRCRQASDWAARWRARSWWNVKPGDPEILLWGAPIELNAQDRLRQWRDALLNQQILSAFDMTEVMMDAYIYKLRKIKPACVYGYASSLALIARFSLENGLPPGSLGSKRLKAIFVTGEVLFDHDREVIETAFEAPVVNEYGCRDGGVLAFQCPAGNLHVPSELVVLELLDAQDRPVAPGEQGEVVVTPLEAYATPMIRYRLGDMAKAITGHTCSCGRHGLCLSQVSGRVTDQIVCREGDRLRRMHALSLIYVLREADGLRQFRIIQPSLDKLDVEIVTNDQFTPDVEYTIIKGLRQRVGREVDINIQHRDHIETSASGKHNCVISHVE